MPLTKKILITSIAIILLVSSFSGCLLNDLLGITTFELNTWAVSDDEGYASIDITFTCSGTVTIKMFSSGSTLIDTHYYFKGSHNATVHLAEYRCPVSDGRYYLKAYDKNGREIFAKPFSFVGPDLTITACEQKWWKRDAWIGGYSLIGLKLTVENSGDVPAYPYNVILDLDSEQNTSLALPCAVMPGQSEYVKCFVYRRSEPDDTTFVVSLEDKDENTMVEETFSVNVQDNVPITHFSWSYAGQRRPNVPEPEYLYEYYIGLERLTVEDYGLYVFDPYDDDYIDILIECLMFGYTQTGDVNKINYIASFVQGLDYKVDSEVDSTYEYPNYPMETLFTGNGGGDCEDKAILAAQILDRLGYDVALLRLPNHMAVGVKLGEETLPTHDFYVEDYYFLETTTSGNTCGNIPNDYKSLTSQVTVYPISSRALLSHYWEGDSIIIYTNTEIGDLVRVTLYVENLGIATAENVKVIAGFYRYSGLKVTTEEEIIGSIDPGMKKKVTLSINIPSSPETWFKTRIYYNYEIVDEKESVSSFPT